MNGEYLPYLQPTKIVDSDHPSVVEYAKRAVEGLNDPEEIAVRLYLAVRDGIWYDPHVPFDLPLYYTASYVLEAKHSFCVPKASLLCALSRACNIPCRLGFANVRNHLAGSRLLKALGTDVFVYHAFVEFHLNGKWIKATPAFNRELCKIYRVPPLEFNGRDDSMFQSFNEENRQYMQYLQFLGTYPDVPVDEILAAWETTYGVDRLKTRLNLYAEREREREVRPA